MKFGMRIFFLFSLIVALSSCAQVPVDEPRQDQHHDENSPEFYLEVISGLQQKRLFFASLAHLDAFEQRWPNDHRVKMMRADALRQVGDFAQARQIYQAIVEKDPSAKAYHGLGLIAAAEKDFTTAAKALNRAASLAPIDVRILNDLGYLQLLQGQREAARLNLHKAAELDANNQQIGANLVLWFLLEGDIIRAEQTMQKYGFDETQRISMREEARRIRENTAEGRAPQSN